MSERKSSGKDFIDELGELLTENNLQVTFTGWKLELEKSEAKVKELQEYLEIQKAITVAEMKSNTKLQEKLSAARDALEEAFEQLKVAADNLCNCKEAECLPTDQEVQQAYSAATSVNEALETLQAFTSD